VIAIRGQEMVEKMTGLEQSAQQGQSSDVPISRGASGCLWSDGQQSSAAAAGLASSWHARETPPKQKSDEISTRIVMSRMNGCIIH